MPRSPTRVSWHRPLIADLERANLKFVDDASRRTAMVTSSAAPITGRAQVVLKAISKLGLPKVEGATTAKQYAIGLLRLAAEVEQALMVQYLYGVTTVSSAEGATENYRQKLLAVAIQEMCHLASVQNLLVLLGGRQEIYMQRDRVRLDSPIDPIPFVLEGITRVSLAKYVAAEMPAVVPSEIAQTVEELVRIAEADAGVELNRVGVIYTILEWMFLSADQAGDLNVLAELPQLPTNPHLSDADMQPPAVIDEFAATPEEWEFPGGDDPGDEFILSTPKTRNDAVKLIREVSEQGEGLGGQHDSHFIEFLEMVKALDDGKMLAGPMPKSPKLGAGGKTITNPYTALWAEVFNHQYGLLVLTIYHSLVTSRAIETSAARREGLASLAMRGMRQVILELSMHLASLPLTVVGDAATEPAGPPYELDSNLLEPGDEAELVGRHLTTLDRLQVLYGLIEQSPEFIANPGHANVLTNLKTYDKRRRKIVAPPTGPVIT